METFNRNPELWKKAQARTRFQSHLVVYLVVNAFLWLLWALLPYPSKMLPWPIFSTFFWGLSLLRHGVGAYGNFNQERRTQREYERLLRAQAGRQGA